MIVKEKWGLSVFEDFEDVCKNIGKKFEELFFKWRGHWMISQGKNYIRM